MTADDWRDLWARALTLDERIEIVRAGGRDGGAVDPGDVEAIADTWCERCAKGDREKFRARLAWEGLTEADLPALAGARPSATEPEPRWLALLSRAGELFAAGLSDSDSEFAETVPFAELWLAFAHAGAEHLPPQWLHEEIIHFLARRLAPMGAPIVYRGFDAFRAQCQDPSHAYAAWLIAARATGAGKIFRDFPVLARTLATVTLTAVETIDDMSTRWEADRAAITEAFGVAGDPAALEPGLSDRHYEGRQVMRVVFENNVRVIYKPKSVDLDGAFQHLLARLHAAAPDVFPRPLQIIVRDGYGWVECVDQDDFAGPTEAAEYFRRGGGLLAVAYALEGRDFIMDNLIATTDGPAAIDTETALQPLCLPGGAEKFDRTRLIEQLLKGRDFSVLDTGLLPVWMPAGTTFYDLSGLGGQSGYISALRQETWENVGTGLMRCVTKPVLVDPEKNQVRINGVPQSATDFGDDIERGFAEGYRQILETRSEINDLIAGWAPLRLRFLLRTTNTYGQLLKKLLTPDALRSGLGGAIEADILCRPWISGPTPPPIASFLREEIAALQRFDVPCFHLRAEGDEHPYLLASPLAMARDRLSRLGEADLWKQSRVVRASVRLKPRRYLGGIAIPHDPFPETTAAKAAAQPTWVLPKASLIAQAEAVGESLVIMNGAGVAPGSDPAVNAFLYDGAPGKAVLFSALWAATEKPKWRDEADRALENWLLDVHSARFRESAASLPVGAASGLASLAYAVRLCSRFRHEPRLLETAAHLAQLVTPEMIAADTHLDVFSGAAGAALVFATLAADEPETGARFRQLAVSAAERLLETAIEVRGGSGLMWETAGERYVGYGHGAAGMAAALARVGALTGEERFTGAARRTMSLIDGLHSESDGWPHLLRGDEPVIHRMESLCHGTPGLAVAFAEAHRAGALDAPHSITRARARLAALDPHPVDTVCCGNAGRIEAWLAIGVDVDLLTNFLIAVFKRREPLGLFRTSYRRSDIYACDSGFFRGHTGIGYSLLRLGEPHLFPSVAAWQ